MIFSKKNKNEEPQIDEIVEAIDQPVNDVYSEPELNYREPKRAAPLFVKLDKYKDILQTMDEMKKFVKGLKDTFNLLNEIEDLKRNAFDIIRTTIQHIEKNLIEVDAEMLRPGAVDMEVEQSGKEISHVEDSVKDLQKQLEMLKRELEELR